MHALISINQSVQIIHEKREWKSVFQSQQNARKRSFLSEKTVREKSRLAPAHVNHEIYTWEYIGVMLYIFISQRNYSDSEISSERLSWQWRQRAVIKHLLRVS